jgi:hypothetical protein
MCAGWIRFGPALSASVLERQEYSRTIELHFTVLYRYVQLRNLGDAQITQLTSGGFHGILCGILPGFRAGSDDLHYLIDRVCRSDCLAMVSPSVYLDRLSGPCYQRCTLPWCGRIVRVLIKPSIKTMSFSASIEGGTLTLCTFVLTLDLDGHLEATLSSRIE